MSNRGRKRKPTELKKIQGSRDRQAEKNKNDKIETMDKLPLISFENINTDELCNVGCKYFKELYDKLSDASILSSTDIDTLKILADSYAQYWIANNDILMRGYLVAGRRRVSLKRVSSSDEFDLEDYEEAVSYEMVKNPSITIKQQAWERIRALQGEFGLTPASRSKIGKVDDDGEDDLLGALLNFKRD